MPSPPHLRDIRAQFASLNTEGERLGVQAGFEIPAFDDDRYSVFHDGGGRNNHFQGVQRKGNTLFVTGSFPFKKRRSDLFVLEMGSRPADPGPWGSNLVRSKNPPNTDRLVSYFRIDPTLWHPGSFALEGDRLIVPIEGSGLDSVITFVDISNPAAPVRVTTDDIVRPTAKAGAVTATRLPSGHLLVAAWADSDSTATGAAIPFHMELYVSANPQSPYQFRQLGIHLPLPGTPFHNKWQGMDLLWQESAAGRELFLIAFQNTDEPQPDPTDPGINVASLHTVNLPARWLQANFDPSAEPLGAPLPNLLSFEADHVFSHEGDWYNMDAGSGAYVDSNQQLIVYSVYHHRAPFRDTSTARLTVKCCEFRSTAFADRIDRIEDAWVELYEGPGSGGRRLVLLGPFDSSIEDTEACFVADKVFNQASATRFQIPAGRAYVLYPRTSFEGEGAVVLQGSGKVEGEDLDNLAPFRFRSCRFLPLSVALALPGVQVVL